MVLCAPVRYIRTTKTELEKLPSSECRQTISDQMRSIFLAAIPNHVPRAMSMFMEQTYETQAKQMFQAGILLRFLHKKRP